jgi:hypothetical protein
MLGMDMKNCPHCGALNSTKREYCYECDGMLSGEVKPEDRDYVATCATCAHAAVFPPPGHRLAPTEVWCTERDEAVPSSMVSGDCFEEAFGWKREDILD